MRLTRVRVRILPLIAALVGPAAVASQAPAIAIRNISLVNVAAGTIEANSTVIVAADTITAVGRNLTLPPSARIIDGAGKFLMPGLWDMHAHCEAAGKESLELYVANGVTGTRDMGSDLDLVLGLRNATANAAAVGPTLVVAGPILDDAPGDWPFRRRVRTAAEARDAVRLLKTRGVDFVKVHDHTPREVYFAIVQEARSQGLPVDGHVPTRVTLLEAMETGQRTVEHLANFRVFTECSGDSTYRPEACRPFFDEIARRGQWHTPTLAASRVLPTVGTSADDPIASHHAFASPSLRAVWETNQRASRVTPEMVRMFTHLSGQARLAVRDMQRAGVGILAGCDALVPGYCIHDELAAMVQSGLTPIEAIRTATMNPARALGQDARRGSIATGKVADLVLLDANPLIDISNTRRIDGVVVRGRHFTKRELDAMLQNIRTRFSGRSGRSGR